MCKIFVAVLTLMCVTVSTVPAFANSMCKERRDACYSVIDPAVRKSVGHKCKADYERCIRADSSALYYRFVPTIPGLGSPMAQPYPTAAVPVNAGTAISNAAALNAAPTGNVRAIGNLIRISPSMPATGMITGTMSNGAPSSGIAATLGGTSLQGTTSVQGNSPSQGVPSPGGASSSGSSGRTRAN